MSGGTTDAPDRIGIIPVDLAAVFAAVGLTGAAVYLPVIDESLLRPVIGLCFVLFVPGYALVSALFPETASKSTPAPDDSGAPDRSTENPSGAEHGQRAIPGRRIDGIERVALSFALSIAIVPLLAFAVTVSPLEFASAAMFVTLAVFTVACTIVAVGRRRALPEPVRFRVRYRAWIARQTDSGSGTDAGVDTVLSVGLIVAALLTVGLLGFATVSPPNGEAFTDFYILTEGDDGELVAAEYPETLSPDDPDHIHIGLENNEHEAVEYTVVVQLQQVSDAGDGETVAERTEIDRFSTTLAHDEAWLQEAALTAPGGMSGEDRRLVVLLYDGDAPATPTRENADENLHLWVDVEVGASEGGAG